MTTLTFFTAIDDSLYSQAERSQVQWLTAEPAVGDRIHMGDIRLWAIAAIDRYSGESGTIRVAHVHPVGLGIPERQQWHGVRSFSKRPETSLSLYIRPDGGLQQWRTSFIGEVPRIGYLLPHYDIEAHAVTSQPWGVNAIETYAMDGEFEFPCYRLIHVGKCIAVDLETQLVRQAATLV